MSVGFFRVRGPRLSSFECRFGREADYGRALLRPSPGWLSLARGPPQSLVHLAASASGLAARGVALQRAAVIQARWLPPPVGLLGRVLLDLFKNIVEICEVEFSVTRALVNDLLPLEAAVGTTVCERDFFRGVF